MIFSTKNENGAATLLVTFGLLMGLAAITQTLGYLVFNQEKSLNSNEVAADAEEAAQAGMVWVKAWVSKGNSDLQASFTEDSYTPDCMLDKCLDVEDVASASAPQVSIGSVEYEFTDMVVAKKGGWSNYVLAFVQASPEGGRFPETKAEVFRLIQTNSVLDDYCGSPLIIDGELEKSTGTPDIGLTPSGACQESSGGTHNADVGGDFDLGSQADFQGGVDAGGALTTGSNSVLKDGARATDDIDIGNDSLVTGGADSTDGGDITVGDRSTLEGGAETDGSVDIGQEGVLRQGVVAQGDVDLGDLGELTGGVETEGDVTVGEDASLDGGIQTSGEVELGKHSIASGGVETDDDVDLLEDAKLSGGIENKGETTVGKRAEVTGGVSTEGDTTIDSGAAITGGIETQGALDVEQDANLEDGDLKAEGDMDIGSEAKVEGDLDVGGDLTISSGATIEGCIQNVGGEEDIQGTVSCP